MDRISEIGTKGIISYTGKGKKGKLIKRECL